MSEWERYVMESLLWTEIWLEHIVRCDCIPNLVLLLSSSRES